MMINQKNVVSIVLLLVVVGLGFWMYKVNKNKDYSVVYLTTGEVYIGKLTTFPDFQLRDSYILEIVKDPADPEKSNFQLSPIDEALWATQTLHLIKKNVVFYASVMPGSKIGQALIEQGK